MLADLWDGMYRPNISVFWQVILQGLSWYPVDRMMKCGMKHRTFRDRTCWIAIHINCWWNSFHLPKRDYLQHCAQDRLQCWYLCKGPKNKIKMMRASQKCILWEIIQCCFVHARLKDNIVESAVYWKFPTYFM